MKVGKVRKQILRTALLFIIVTIIASCSRAGDIPERTPVRELVKITTSPATTSPTLTATPAPTATPTEEIAPTTPAPTATPARPPTPAGPLQGEDLVLALRSGGFILYFRHAATEPLPDDAYTVVLSDCEMQRNLSSTGRTQASGIGQAIAKLEIPVGSVLSSPFCRALDTARLAFGKAAIDPVLENLETANSEAEREARIEGLRRLLSTPPEDGTNSVLAGHGFNISAAADVTIAEGEAAVFQPVGEAGFTLITTVTSGDWQELSVRFASEQ